MFDGDRYRYYKTIEHFLDCELTSKNRGKWFYAHAGGLADLQFIVQKIIERGARYTMRASFSGSSAVIVHITQGKNAWHFVDSYWLFRTSLRAIGKSIGMRKTGPTDECDNCEDGEHDKCMTRQAFDSLKGLALSQCPCGAFGHNPKLFEDYRRWWYGQVGMQELVEYNENDCRILFKAITLFQIALLDMGGQLQMTLASSAMYLFRRKYLKQEIATAESVNECAFKAYFASRVEVFDGREIANGSNYYDINSSFPYAMTKPLPGRLILNQCELPDEWLDEDSPHLYIADVEVEVPDCYLPSVPYRSDERVFFPMGRWRSWLSSIDLQVLVREGGKLHKVHEIMEFEPFSDMANFVMDIYERRRQTTDKFEKLVYKLILNSLYGKFAESMNKSTLHINPPANTLGRLDMDQMLFPGAWLEDVKIPIPHRHVPLSTHITAYARKTLLDFLIISTDYHYCDTDGFSTTDLYNTSDTLGALKMEKRMDWALFHGPKLYGYKDDGKRFHLKAKGMSIRNGTEETFRNLIEGKEIEVIRMSRLKENLRRGIFVPNEKIVTKVLRGTTQPKRFMYPDGATRPWHVSELLFPKKPA